MIPSLIHLQMIIYKSFFIRAYELSAYKTLFFYGVKKQDFEKHGQVYYIVVSQPRLS